MVFIGRHDPRKGLPSCCAPGRRSTAETGARLRLIGTDPLQYPLLHARLRFDEAGIDVLGIVTNEVRTASSTAKVPCRRPSAARASGSCSPRRSRRDPGGRLGHPRLRSGRDARVRRARSAGRPDALAEAIVALLSDETPGRDGTRRTVLALASYSWDDIARRLEETYLEVCA